jgi:ATP-binding cassette subfamily F protein 1
MSNRSQKNKKNEKLAKAEKQWMDEEPKPVSKKQPKKKPQSEESGSSSQEEVEQKEVEVEQETKKDMSKRELIKLQRELRSGAITKEQFEEATGVLKEKERTDEEKMEDIKGQEYKSGLQSYKEKKGELTTNARDIKIEEVTVSYQKKQLLESTTVIINHGRKYGLIGPNGSGKSTLLRHISQRHIPIPPNINMLHVEQEIEGTEQTALEAVIAAVC